MPLGESIYMSIELSSVFKPKPGLLPRYGAGLMVSLILAPASWAAEAVRAPEDPRELEITASIAQYERDLIGLGGAYNRISTELNLSLAEAYIELEDFGRAMDAYAEALQSIRISSGLYSEEQLPILEQFSAGAIRAQDWSRTESNLHLAYSIAEQLYQVDDPRFGEIATRYADWKVRAYQGDLLPPQENNPIDESIEIYDSIISAISPDSENYHDNLIDLLSAKGLAHYYSALYVDDSELEDFQGTANETVNQQVCVSRPRMINGVVTYVRVCRTEHAPNPEYFESRARTKSRQLGSNLKAMRESYQQVVETLEDKPEVTPLEIAHAILSLGDINLLINDLEAANTQYTRAYQYLAMENVSQSLRDQVFSRPQKALEVVLARFSTEDENDIALSGIVTFSVSKEGKIADARIAGEESDIEEPNRSLVVEKLQSSFFRPAIVDGVAVDSEISMLAADL